MNYTTPEAKKEEFRRYLESGGVVDLVTKALVALYEEPDKPLNPIDFVREYFTGTSSTDVSDLQEENDRLKSRVKDLLDENEQLKSQLTTM
ncbi:hypothetical protein PCE1_002436 [Barthelona sp. PCE]